MSGPRKCAARTTFSVGAIPIEVGNLNAKKIEKIANSLKSDVAP